MLMTPTGHTAAHLPQPVQRAASVACTKFVLYMALGMASRRVAIIASQQQAQQWQMKFT
jgi:hypothetical protein